MAKPVKAEAEGPSVRVHILPTARELARAAAGRLWGIARERATSGTVHIALSGGETPKDAYGMLAAEPYRRGFPWEAAQFWQVDERFVPPGDPRSNRRMIERSLLEPARVPPERFHGVDTTLPDPAAAAAAYEAQLRDVLPGRFRGLPRFDVMVLGIGPDGHTASLFPGSAPAPEQALAVAVGPAGDPPVPRVSMTFPLINAAARIVFLVQGASKAKPLLDLVASSRDPSLRTPSFPAGMVAPARGTLLILADAEAGSLLPTDWKG